MKLARFSHRKPDPQGPRADELHVTRRVGYPALAIAVGAALFVMYGNPLGMGRLGIGPLILIGLFWGMLGLALVIDRWRLLKRRSAPNAE